MFFLFCFVTWFNIWILLHFYSWTKWLIDCFFFLSGFFFFSFGVFFVSILFYSNINLMWICNISLNLISLSLITLLINNVFRLWLFFFTLLLLISYLPEKIYSLLFLVKKSTRFFFNSKLSNEVLTIIFLDVIDMYFKLMFKKKKHTQEKKTKKKSLIYFRNIINFVINISNKTSFSIFFFRLLFFLKKLLLFLIKFHLRKIYLLENALYIQQLLVVFI